MAKQNVRTNPTRVGVVSAKKGVNNTIVNSDGLSATKRGNKSELFILAVGRFFGEGSYYEGDSRKRFVELVHKITKSDPEWMAAFLKWLRNDANIRTAAIVGAAEYVKAGGPNGRSVVKSVIVRADEPAEMLAYWINTYGKRVPQPIKRGVRDSASRLYNERNFARWDSKSNAVRMADVIELTHPAPSGNWQSDLFKFAIEDRHGRATFEGKTLPMLEARSKCSTRKDYVAELRAGNPTISWENVSSAEAGKMTAAQWTEMYTYMGYMAKLRNLRNLDEAKVAIGTKRSIGADLADPENVAKSRQLPMRFYSAYKNVSDDVWKSYLSEALDHSLANVPTVRGNWLVLVDASGSMAYDYSRHSDLNYYDAATVFASAFAGANSADIRTYSSVGQLSPVLSVKGKNTLRIVEDLHNGRYNFGGGTDTFGNLQKAFNAGKYDGVLLLTDEQYNGGGGWYGHRHNPSDAIPKDVPLYTFNLAGYKAAQEIGPNRINVGGLSDSAFSMIAAVENSKAKWPWE
jgi:TROVE domain